MKARTDTVRKLKNKRLWFSNVIFFKIWFGLGCGRRGKFKQDHKEVGILQVGNENRRKYK